MELPDILSEENVSKAAKLLERYYLHADEKTGRLSSGSYFDEWAGRGDAPDVRDRITDSDIVAVSMLSIKVPPAAAIGLLDPEITRTVTDLLSALPTDVEMHSLSPRDFHAILGPHSPAWKLWNELRRNDAAKWGVGATTASKILHRKRPHLIPIWDDVIGQVIGKRGPKNQWANWHALLTDGTGLPDRLDRIHQLSGAPIELSKVRIMDAVLWRRGRDLGFKGGRAAKAAPDG